MTLPPALRRYAGHPFWQAIAVLVLSYVAIVYGIPLMPGSAPVPKSVVLQFMATILVGVLIYVSDNEERWARFREPITAVLVEPPTEFAHEQPTKGIWVTQERTAAESFTTTRGSADVVSTWHYLPPKGESQAVWIIVLGPEESLDALPDWAMPVVGDDAALLVAPRGCGPLRWEDKPPYYLQRSMALLGRTTDSGRVVDVAALIEHTHHVASTRTWKIAGRGQAVR